MVATFFLLLLTFERQQKAGKRQEKEQPQKKKEQPQKEKNSKRTEKEKTRAPGQGVEAKLRPNWSRKGGIGLRALF